MTLSNDVLLQNLQNLINVNSNFQIKKNLISNTELLPQEFHLKILKFNISIMRAHKNQDDLRIQFFLTFLKNSLISHKLENLDCEFIVNTSEGIENENLEVKRFCYAAKEGLDHILIPDSHNFITDEKISSLNSLDIPFKEKQNSAIFIGSDTGNLKNGYSLRSFFCDKNRSEKNIFSKLIGNIRPEIKDSIQNFKEIEAQPLSIKDQLKHKIVISIDGNSTSWERPLWAMASNSLCVKVEPFSEYRYKSWHDSMVSFLPVVPCVSAINFKHFMNNNFEDDFWKNLKANQKIISFFISNLKNQYLYLSSLLNEYNRQYNSI
jgi:hypothetical protein